MIESKPIKIIKVGWWGLFFALISTALLLSNSQAFAYDAINPEIRDSFGNLITGNVKTGQPIQIGTSLTNNKEGNQTFAYIFIIEDKNGVRVLISWITGTLYAGQSIHPVHYWTPTASGSYEAYALFYQSFNNTNNIQPMESTTIEVS